ncbi:AraC family transcriptional regulator [Niabella drilacis]|uniref:AraC-type DNA-binding protein n=1 Tax=Niabella drilacis (strain DSM 25811 / CCM 8410 / CCUG 62505 / LMG 26954 / E90) TaxID=1285928 RepID=A0A1G6Q156_NIADE|nr:AraC family transcriptional regulator [Niabella drilacis]SDC85516.1 AraC-type DNA-binding protein [Niabella drilacis]
MKPSFEHVDRMRVGESFVVYDYEAAHFPFRWHYHPEYELTLILSGSGKRLVGDNYTDFLPGDLVLLGGHLPHTWSSEPVRQRVAAVVIQFSAVFIAPVLEYPECRGIAALLQQSERGLFFRKRGAGIVMEKIKRLSAATGVEKLLSLIEILHLLSKMNAVPVSASAMVHTSTDRTEERINKVFQHIYRNYRKPFRIEQLSRLVHLSPGAFCKFFKKITGKTFSDYVNDIRVARSCTLLLETDLPVAQIAYATGFESITYFNRVFFRKKKTTPRAFRLELKARQEIK